MAFIRWKRLKHGTVKAYLVHSYRDKQGRPRHKTLAYLGDKAELSGETIEALKQRHSQLAIQWDRIKPSPNRLFTDIRAMTDGDLLKNLRALRRERGISWRHMPYLLQQAGALSGGDSTPYQRVLTSRVYLIVENGFAEGKGQSFYENPVRDLVPALRKMFGSV